VIETVKALPRTRRQVAEAAGRWAARDALADRDKVGENGFSVISADGR
jgi:hypothetical protein